MNSLDFLTPREVVGDCVRLAAIPSLAACVVGCLIWAAMALMGRSSDEEPAYALLMPFVFSALYGNVVVFNTRWKHGVRVLRGVWWYWLTGLAVAWTAACTLSAFLMNAALIHWGVLDRDFPSIAGMAQVLAGAIGISLFMSLLPAKEQLVT